VEVGYPEEVKLDNGAFCILNWANLTNFKSKLRLNIKFV
jgi:hypothetical protein